MSILGNRVRRVEDPRFLTVGGTYTADLRDPLLDGALHVTYLRSTVAHATITSIDVTDALKLPGVVAVVTGDDIDLPPLSPSPEKTRSLHVLSAPSTAQARHSPPRPAGLSSTLGTAPPRL